MNDKVKKMDRIILISILAAMSYLLMLIAIPVIPIAPYLKLDLSDLPILVGTVMLGIPDGVVITGLKIFLHLILIGLSITNFVGDLTSLIASITILVVIRLLINGAQQSKIRKHLLVWIETVTLTTVMILSNLLITPLYVKMAGLHLDFSLTKLIVWGVLPFNLIKGLVTGYLFLPLYKALKHSRYFRTSWR